MKNSVLSQVGEVSEEIKPHLKELIEELSKGIMEELNKNDDDLIQWSEFK